MIWNERGLTLAEILVAVAILGIGLVGLAVVVPIASYGVQEGSQLSTATFLAEQRLEQVRNAPWTGTPANDCIGSGAGAPVVPGGVACANGTIALAAGATTFADEANVVWGNTTSVTAVTGGYSRQVRIADCDPTPCAGLTSTTMRRVTVSVTYRPLTSSGVSPTDKTVSVQWLVTRK
ncbi:MAG: prepilin-type N-terminal cleavage/methylation domain-containing protein [Candidatus Rokuibacteriota bacterium]